MSAISFEAVRKIYEPDVEALSEVTFDIREGEIFALLGPNGAGKSTLIHILVGLAEKTSGRISVFGKDQEEDPIGVKRSLGFVPQELGFDPFFTPLELLQLTRGYYGLAPDPEYINQLLDIFSLTPEKNKKTRQLSGGMRRRLLVARALVHRPPVLLLDEPTAGVDVELRQSLWDTVLRLREEGTTILLTTHYLEEAEDYSDRTCIISHGKVLALDDTRSMIDKLGRDRVLEVRMAREIDRVPEALAAYNARISGASLFLTYQPGEAGELIKRLAHLELGIEDLRVETDDLEDVFLQLTRKKE